jgi:spermidine synthase
MEHRYLYFTVFASGMTTLAVELTASRLLGAVFGVSNLVWASIIGLILIYLTVGYFLGGKWADWAPYPATMYRILAWGAFTAGLVPVVSRPVLSLAADAFDQLAVGVLLGSFLSVLILFIIPITLLGTISPFAIRLAITDSKEAGAVSGRIYAISTMGSFLGTFLPVLVLIPLIGTTMTFLAFSGFLLLVAYVGLWRAAGWRAILPWLWMLIVLILLAVYWTGRPVKQTIGQIYENESAYNYIQVLERDGDRILRLNEGQGEHSRYNPTRLDYRGPWEQFLAAPFFNAAPFEVAQVKRMAIIGLAAGTTARQATAVFGPIPIDGYEIDPGIIDVGREYFDMNQPNLNAIPQDGRIGLASSSARYTIIALDAYRPPYIPWHLTTREFFVEVYGHLEPEGALVVNVGRAPNDRRLIEALVGTIGSVFPSVYVMDLPDTFNSLIYATVQPTAAINLVENYTFLAEQGAVHPLLLEVIRRAGTNLRPTPETDLVFTDDWAPIEWITNNMVLNFVLRGGTEDLE